MANRQQRWILGGGMASGKSLVRKMLADAGIATIDADSIGHRVLEPDGPAFGEVSERWPDVVVEGRIDRSQLASIVFGDPEALGELERLTHPHIFDTIKEKVEEISGAVVVEIPLVTDHLGTEWKLMVVDCRDEMRLARAVERGMTPEDAKSRIDSQLSRAGWLAAADLVIPNHGSVEELEQGVKSVVECVSS